MDYITQQKNIKFIRDKFEDFLAKKLNLTRVSAPIFLEKSSGLTDRLSGVEKAIEFQMSQHRIDCEINHSLAKWKRVALHKYGFPKGRGLYTNMNAIRKDEVLDDVHSIYVDQWDWEAIIDKDQRNLKTLKEYASLVYESVLQIRNALNKRNGTNDLEYLPEKLFFISSQKLEDLYPHKTPKQREDLITKKYKAVFLIGIGHKLTSNKKHDDRSPDYDDWDLNGDLLVWNDVIKKAFELSSMGIRVDSKSLNLQLKIANALDRLQFKYHQDIIDSQLPFTIGGGIGQSRLCMLLLKAKHIGEVQSSVWPSEMKDKLLKKGIKLL